MTTYVPVLLDIFENHHAFLVKELEPSITSVAHSCREADIITQEFYDKLIQVPGTNKHKARKLVNAVSDGIEAQPVDIEQKNCIYQCFVGVLRQDSFERAAVKLEASLAEREERANNNVACTEDVGNQGDPLDQTITSDHRDEIGKNLSYWKKYAKALRLCDAEIEGIDGDKTLDYVMTGQKVLELWSHKYNATYRILGEVCLKLGHRHIAEKICNMVNGDLSNLSCPDDAIVKDSIYFEAPRVSEDVSGPVAFPSTVTSPDMPGQLEVETMRPNQATSYDGRQEQVTDGVRLRRDTPEQLTNIIDLLYSAPSTITLYEDECADLKNQATSYDGRQEQVTDGALGYLFSASQLTNIIDLLYNARMQARIDKSTITLYEDECADLKQQLRKTVEEKNLIFGQLKDKQKQLRTLRFQDRMTETRLKSDAELEQAKTEQLEEEYRQLQEKIVKCEQENKDLSAELQTFRSMESCLLQQIDELREEVRKLTDRRFCYATLLSHKWDRQFILRCAVFVGSAVSCVVFILLSMFLLIFYLIIMHKNHS